MRLSINVKQNLSIFQTNQITHWLDASNVYGSSEEEIDLLRTKTNGQMEHGSTIRSHPRSSTTNNVLPTCPESSHSKGSVEKASDHICAHNGCDKKCFIAGT